MVSISESGLKSVFFCSDERQIFIQPVIAFKDLKQIHYYKITSLFLQKNIILPIKSKINFRL